MMLGEFREKEVFLVRHGESTANASRIHRGTDPKLTDIGLEQTNILAKRIARIPNLGAVISSPLPRSMETAKVISSVTGIALEHNELFDPRRRPSVLQGKSHFDPFAKQIMSEIFAGYLLPGYRHSDEENLDDLKHRARKALEFLVRHPAETICVVTHGSFLWVLFCAVFAGPDFGGIELQRAIEALGPDNAGITRLVYIRSNNPISGIDSVRWRVKSWSDIAHLDMPDGWAYE